MKKYFSLCLILFLFLWTTSAQSHTLHVTDDTDNNSQMGNDFNGGNTRISVGDQNATRQGFAQFDLATLPAGTVSTDIDKATLRLLFVIF